MNYLKYLNDRKSDIGFGNYTITLSNCGNIDVDEVATTKVQPSFLSLNINLYKQFYELSFKDRLETLDHELIHSRVALFNIKMEDSREKEEESMVNDITRFKKNGQRTKRVI